MGETGFQRFVSALYVGYYVVLGLGFGLLLGDGLPSPWPSGTVSDAAFRYQGASAMVVVITVLHLVLGLYYAEADPSLRRRPGQSWTSWYSETRICAGWRDLTADTLLLVALVVGIVGLECTAYGRHRDRETVGAPRGGCTARVGTGMRTAAGATLRFRWRRWCSRVLATCFACGASCRRPRRRVASTRCSTAVRETGGRKRTSESGGWLELRQVVDPLRR